MTQEGPGFVGGGVDSAGLLLPFLLGPALGPPAPGQRLQTRSLDLGQSPSHVSGRRWVVCLSRGSWGVGQKCALLILHWTV